MADRIFPYGEAPGDAEYVVLEPNPDLPNAKELLAGTGISVTVGANTVTISGDGSSAQTYITANDETSTLPNSFQIVEGSNVTLDYVGNQLIISASVSGSGGGTVTIVNSGNANPLFSTNVTTATTTPTIAYTLLAAASATFFRGPASGTSGTPVYGGILGTDLTGALTAGTGITITPATAPGSRLTINAVGFQPISSTLNALSSSLSGTGYITQVGPDSFAERTFQDSTNITWTNPAGIAGDSSANVTSNVYTKSDYSLLNQLASTTPSLGQVPMGASDGSYRLTKPNAGTGIQMDFSNGVFTVSATGATGNPGTLTNFTSSPPPAIFGTSVANPTTAPVLSFNITSNTLQDLATSSGTGIVVSTDVVHHAFRQVQGTSGEIDVTNPAGTAGDITLSLDSSVYTNRDSSVLNALATGLTGTGFVSQNGAQFYDRTLTGTSNRLTITNPTGAAGDPVFDIGTDVLVVGDVTALPGIQIVNGSGTIQVGASGALGGTLTSVGDISPLWTTNVTGPNVTFTLNDLASGQVLIGPLDGVDAPGTLRRLLGEDISSAVVAGANVTISLIDNQLVISSTASGGGGGSVLSVDAQDLPPLFTTNVTNPSTTPDIVFTLTNANDNTFLSGPASGGPSPGSYRTLTGLDLIPALSAGTNITLAMVGDHLEISSTGSSGSGYTTVEEEGTPLPQRDTINFVGAGITASDDSGGAKTQVSLDATLNSLATFSATGIMVSQGSDTFVGREIVGTPNQVTVAQGNGIPGNITLGLDSGIDTNLLADGSVSNTEFQYLDGATSNIQAQLDQKQPTSNILNRLASSTPGNGQIPIGDGVNFQIAAPFAGPGIQINAGVGTLQVLSSGAANALITAGDLAPLFTTSESANNLAFTLSNTASATFLAGPATGSNGPWVNRGILGTDLTGALQAGSNITIAQSAAPNSRVIISSSGGFTHSGSTTTGNFTADVQTAYSVDSSAGSVVCTLPTAVGNGGKEIVVEHLITGNSLTFNTTSSQNISGQASGAIVNNTRYNVFRFMSNGANWMLM